MFYGEWDDAKDVFSSFRVNEEDRKGVNIVFAYYSYEDYTGRAFVLFTKEDKLYEVHGSHCSCYGLEGQWEPEETSVELLTHRLQKGTIADFYGQNYEKEIRDALINI